MRRTSSIAIAVISFVFSGCGTALNIKERPDYFTLNGEPTRRRFGGVRLDATFGAQCLHESLGKEEPGEFGRPKLFGMGTYCLLVDMPLCAVADTVTLPYILCAAPGHRHHAYELDTSRPEQKKPAVAADPRGETTPPLSTTSPREP